MPGPFFWFLAVVALATLVTAIGFAFRPAERTLAVLRPLCAATIFAGLASFLLGVMNGLMAFNRVNGTADPGASAQAWQVLAGGLAESPAPLVLAFAGVAVAWLLVAVGLRRQA